MLLAGAAIFVVHLIGGPANGTVLQTAPPSTPKLKSDKILASKYFTTHYPRRYQLLPNQSPSASLQSWTLVGHQGTVDQESSKISMVITTLPAGGAKEDSAYKLFASQPALYKLSTAVYGQGSVIVAKRSDSGYQQTVLWPHGNYLLTVSLTAGTESPLVDSELQTVLSRLQWLI